MEIDLSVGETIVLEGESWELRERLGGGGFGAVHYGVSTDGETVALKFVDASAAADRELLLAAFPDSPHVMPVLDSGEHNGYLVVAMPLAETSLADAIEQNLVESPVDVLSQVLAGLADIEPTVVHRDLKPANILLHDGRWKLTDFGASRVADATTASHTQKMVATAAYAAPERWRLERATPASDIYAFGVLAVEIWAGHRPFPGPTFDDYVEQHLSSAPDLNGVPIEFTTFVSDCLLKAPEARPTAGQLLERLDGIESAPATVLGGALAQANSEASERKVAEELAENTRRVETDRRETLFLVAEDKWNELQNSILTLIKQGASEAEIIYRGGNGTTREPRSVGFEVALNGASLKLPAPSDVSRRLPGLPFDVIACADITVRNLGGQGRSHSFWFCNHTGDTYSWCELAFMLFGTDTGDVPYEPFSMPPWESRVVGAVQGHLGRIMLARPISSVVLDEPPDFAERWVNYFGLAATGQLYPPHKFPETS
jgi:serine/threonine-protein kinase